MFKATSLLCATAFAVKLESAAKAEHGVTDQEIFDAMWALGDMLGYTVESAADEYDTLFAEPVDYDAIRSTSLADSSDFMVVMELAWRLGYHPETIAEAYDRMTAHM